MMTAARLGTPSPFCWQIVFALQKGLEKSNTFHSAYVFAGANHQAGFSLWHAIGWFNTMIDDREATASS